MSPDFAEDVLVAAGGLGTTRGLSAMRFFLPFSRGGRAAPALRSLSRAWGGGAGWGQAADDGVGDQTAAQSATSSDRARDLPPPAFASRRHPPPQAGEGKKDTPQFVGSGTWSSISASSVALTSTLASTTPACCSARPAASIDSRCGAPIRLWVSSVRSLSCLSTTVSGNLVTAMKVFFRSS